MNGIPQGLGIHTAPSAATLPHERRNEVPHAESQRTDATVLTLTHVAAGKSASAPPGLAALYSLLQGMHSAELAAMPPRMTQLLVELTRHLLPVTDLGNTGRIRNLVLHNGLFLESTPGEDDEGASSSTRIPPPLDLKALLGQLLALMQPGRRLTLRNGSLQFISLNPGTAQCLQAYAEEQKHGPRHNKMQARLLANIETAFLGIVRNQLQSLAQSSDKKTRWIIELLINREVGAMAVPVTLTHQALQVPEAWEAEFELDLRHCGPLHVVLGVKNTTVSVSIAAGRLETLERLRAGKVALAQFLAKKGLQLGSYNCLRGQHERLAG